jgi:V8-like Glu-specific endopeptidase
MKAHLAVCILFFHVISGVHAADTPAIDAAALKKVKAATVHLKVTLSDARISQGTGFLTEEAGLVLTNAHVLNMLAPDSRKPSKVEVTIGMGTAESKSYEGKIVGVDRGTDLAFVKIESKKLPERLTFGSTKMLQETQTLYVFGYPFGEQLGKEITVAKTSISSLRKSGDFLVSLQLDGGLNPGNSGGPIVNGKGEVMGVAVSGIRGTSIGNAIPADMVSRFVNGRITAASSDVPYRSGEKLMMDVVVEVVDPLNRLKKVEVELWAGNAGGVREPSTKKPLPQPGDSQRTRHTLKGDKKGRYTLEVPVPKLAGKQVLWLQPVITNGLGETNWVAAMSVPDKPPLTRKPLSLPYQPKAAKQSAQVDSTGEFLIRDESGADQSIGLKMFADINETTDAESTKGFPVQVQYTGFGLEMLVDGKAVPKSQEMRAMQADLRFASAEVLVEKDGNFGLARANIGKVPEKSQEMVVDISNQILQSLEVLSVPIPSKKVEAGETWKAQRTYVIGNAVVAVPATVNITYKYMGITPRDGKDQALIRIDGLVTGRKGDGLDMEGTMTGTAMLSLETGQVVSADAEIRADVDLVFRRSKAKAIASFNVALKRPTTPAK